MWNSSIVTLWPSFIKIGPKLTPGVKTTPPAGAWQNFIWAQSWRKVPYRRSIINWENVSRKSVLNSGIESIKQHVVLHKRPKDTTAFFQVNMQPQVSQCYIQHYLIMVMAIFISVQSFNKSLTRDQFLSVIKKLFKFEHFQAQMFAKGI